MTRRAGIGMVISQFAVSRILLEAVLAASLAACAVPPSFTPTPTPAPPEYTTTPPAAVTVVVPPSPTAVPPTITPSAAPSETAAPPPPTPGPQLCSPLEGVSLEELPDMVAGNTFQTPMPGRDSGHPGVDFAFYRHGDRTTMLGLPLKAAMAGRVAAVLPDRLPYGNALIIEVPLEKVPRSWIPLLDWPTPASPVPIDSRLTCPDTLALPAWDGSRRSLYLLYGHLNRPSPLLSGQSVSCGQVVGEAGTTGASVNPHLHFETRLGPAGATFASLGHYDPRTTAEERNNYCLWRVSGWFQVVDPLAVLAQKP